MKGFIEFVRRQGVVGLAVGFLLGGAVSKAVTALVTDIINPLVGAVLGSTDGLKSAAWAVGESKILWGDMVSTLIDFIIIALVVYFGVRWLKLDKLDRKE